jgi:hypothetical protein
MKELEETITFLEQQIEKLKEIRSSNEFGHLKMVRCIITLKIVLMLTVIHGVMI